jgi:toxin ParE1/3/4
MYHLTFTKLAIKDISEIWDITLENWSEKQADKYYKLISDTFKEIAKKPLKGKLYSNLTPEIFGYKIAKHIIFYRILDKSSIEIIRILHEEMDLKLHLKK